MCRRFTLLICLLLGGCSLLGLDRLERRIAQAQRDHAHCQARGLEYPSAAYEACRRTLADARQREQWLELQLVEQQEAMQNPAMARDPMAGYRPIRPEDFFCYKRTDRDVTYIACEQK